MSNPTDPSDLKRPSYPANTGKTVRAVPIPAVFTSPYPMPKVQTITITKKQGQPLGISFQPDLPENCIVVTKISDTSPLAGTALRVGHVLLAINGVAFQNAKDGVHLIQECHGDQLTVSFCQQTSAPFTKVVVAKPSAHSPGVNFESTRSGCLVMIGKVFPAGPFSDSFARKGDIVLAVNGVSVCKREDADRELRNTLLSGGDDATTILYLMDGEALRQSMIRATVQNYTSSIRIVPDTREFARPRDYAFAVGSTVKALVQFDKESHEMYCPNPELHLQADSDWQTADWASPHVFYRQTFGKHVVPVIQRYNEIVNERLGALEDVICSHVWQTQASAAISLDGTAVQVIPVVADVERLQL